MPSPLRILMQNLQLMRRSLLLVFALPVIWILTESVKINKVLLYDRHTLADSYKYGKTDRSFQWEKISGKIDSLLIFEEAAKEFGALNNYRNRQGVSPLADSAEQDAYKAAQDKYGVRRDQSIPFYRVSNLAIPERYGKDGALVAVISDSAGYLLVSSATFGGEWLVPAKYVDRLGGADFRKLIFIDRTNQNIVTLEQADSTWLVRSMNPVTTGMRRPPYRRETPEGIFVVRGKLEKMFYLHDGKSEVAGYAPWASRFSGGGYLHGVPLAYPAKTVSEFSWSLGTNPRSHMCVRNATSHAKFIYDWAPVGEALVIVFD